MEKREILTSHSVGTATVATAELDSHTGCTWLLLLVQICIPFAWGLLAVHLGQDTDGDQLYYHYYSASAVLSGRFLHDIAAGGLGGFNNPLMYFPFAVAVDHLPAAAVCFLIGAWQGLNITLVLAIARHLIRPANTWGALLCIAIAGYVVASPIFILTVGRTFGDDWVSVPFLAGIWLLLRGPESRRLDWLGGLLIGLAAGMKITNVPTAAAFGVALAISYPQPRKLLAVAAAMIIGFAATAGWWFVFSYRHFGNPLFPYYNAIFKSPLYPEFNFHDTRWKLDHLRDLLLLPARMAKGTTTVIETNYQETHWLTFSFLSVVTIACVVGEFVKTRALAIDRRIAVLAVFCALAFVVWAFMLHYMRYLMVAELVVPLAVAMLMRWVCGSDRAAAIALASLVLISAAVDHYLPLRWSRIEPTGSWYQVPELAIPAGSAVLLGNDIGFVERALPRDTTIIGLGTNYFFAGLPGDGGTPVLNARIADAVWREPANVYQLTLLSLPPKFDSAHVAAQLGFTFDQRACREVPTNLGALQICKLAPAQRIAVPDKLTPR